MAICADSAISVTPICIWLDLGRGVCTRFANHHCKATNAGSQEVDVGHV